MKEFEKEKLMEEYTPKTKTSVDEAISLDKKAKRPAYIFAYTYGIIGALILGLGMCLAMEIIASGTPMMVLGIIIGIIGIAMISTNYPIFKKILQKRKEKYASAIILALNKND